MRSNLPLSSCSAFWSPTSAGAGRAVNANRWKTISPNTQTFSSARTVRPGLRRIPIARTIRRGPHHGRISRRFPQHATKLEQQINLHHLLGSLAPRPQIAPPPPSLETTQEAALWGSGPAPQSPGNSLWPAIPGYEILGETGPRWHGRRLQGPANPPNRPVALKMILGGAFPPRIRFRRASTAKPEAIARIQHANVVQIFETGTVESPPCSHPFFALEYVDGGDLGPWGRGGNRKPPRQAGQLVDASPYAVHPAPTPTVPFIAISSRPTCSDDSRRAAPVYRFWPGQNALIPPTPPAVRSRGMARCSALRMHEPRTGRSVRPMSAPPPMSMPWALSSMIFDRPPAFQADQRRKC